MAECGVLEKTDPHPTYLIKVGTSRQHKGVNITFDCIGGEIFYERQCIVSIFITSYRYCELTR